MSLFSFRGARRKATYRKVKAPRTTRLSFDCLEDRTVLATFTVGAGGNFATLQIAIQSAAVVNGDTLTILAGGALTGQGTLAAGTAVSAAAAGSSTLTLASVVGLNNGDVLSITSATGNEFLTVKSFDPATKIVTFTSNTRVAHVATDTASEFAEGITKQLTITADPNAPRAAITGGLFISTGVNSVSLSHVTMPALTIDQGSSKNTVNDVTVFGTTADNPYPNNATAPVFFTALQVASTTNGSNVFSNSTFGTLLVDGNTTGTATNDQFINDIIGAGAFLINADGTLLQNNPTIFGVLIANGASTAINLNNNTIGAGAVTITQPTATTAVAVNFNGNTISTGGGTGVSLTVFPAAGAGAKVTIVAQGNDLRNNLTAVKIVGDGVDEANGLGNVDFGGGGASSGGNNFKGVLNAYTAFNVDDMVVSTKAVVNAKNNIFNVSDPTKLVNTNGGHGVVNISGVSGTDAFIDTLYIDFLGRAASPAELTPWEGVFASRGPVAVSLGISGSPEALGRDVDALYLRLLGRAADAGGRAGWVAYLQRGGTLEGLVVGIVSSPEFLNKVPTFGFGGVGGVGVTPNSQYVIALYNLILGRAPTADEVAAWLGVLGNQGPGGVAAGIVNSLEFRTNVVQLLYGAPVTAGTAAVSRLGVPNLLRRTLTPSLGEILGNVNTGASILGLEAGFAASAEFQANG